MLGDLITPYSLIACDELKTRTWPIKLLSHIRTMINVWCRNNDGKDEKEDEDAEKNEAEENDTEAENETEDDNEANDDDEDENQAKEND